MTSRNIPNPNPAGTGRFTEHFSRNVDNARNKKEEAEAAAEQSQSQAQTQGGPATMNPASEAADTTDTGRVTEAQTSIDSTNAAWGHRGSRYSFTAETLAHPDESTRPEE